MSSDAVVFGHCDIMMLGCFESVVIFLNKLLTCTLISFGLQ